VTTPKPSQSSLAAALVGTWELTFREDRTTSGALHPDPGLGAHPTGLLIYDARGHFSAQFMKRDRTAGDPSQEGPTKAGGNNSRSLGGYDAYFGRYVVDETTGVVTQTLDGALAAENVGMVVTRALQVRGDELSLELPTTAMDGTPVIRTLRWRRVG